jgi:hydrogenase expression/formation protein HypC
MCLALPGEVLELIPPDKALVKFGSSTIEINLSFVDNVGPGDYVIAHSGFALTKLDEEEAAAQLALWQEYEEHMRQIK